MMGELAMYPQARLHRPLKFVKSYHIPSNLVSHQEIQAGSDLHSPRSKIQRSVSHSFLSTVFNELDLIDSTPIHRDLVKIEPGIGTNGPTCWEDLATQREPTINCEPKDVLTGMC